MATTLVEFGEGEVFREVPGEEWTPVVEWAAGEDGKRRPTDRQERDTRGRGLWKRTVLAQQARFGPEHEVALVEVRRWSKADPNEEAIDLD